MLQIVIPMAGEGSRFKDAGYGLPKPFLPIFGQPMISRVMSNLKPLLPHKFFLICKEEHKKNYDLEFAASLSGSPYQIITTQKSTRGAAESVMLAENFLNREEPLMIANSDQLIELDINKYLESIKDVDGLIMTLKSDDPKWSYAKTDAAGNVQEVREKEVISNDATTGIYNFERAKDFLDAAKLQIAQDQTTLGEFYVAPVYNELIAKGMSIKIYNIELNAGIFHGLGTPEDYEKYLCGFRAE